MTTATAQKLTTLRAELHADASSLPAPSADAGGDVSAWDYPRYVAIEIAGDGAITLSGAQLCLRDRVTGAWRVVRDLHGGSDIALTATLGYEEVVELVAGADRLAFTGTVSSGAVTIHATPIEARA